MLCRFVSVAAALFPSVVPVFGQGFVTAEFNGSVVDQSGGALPGVTITVTEETTGVVQTVVSHDVGRFVLPAMPPGRYTIRTELSGFQSQVTDVGRDNRDTGGDSRDVRRLRGDGTIQPRNDVTGDPLHRVDLRLQKRLSVGGRRTIDGLFEVFNLFNHENYGSYVTHEANANYGQPEFDEALACQPRMLQLGSGSRSERFQWWRPAL